MNDRRVASLTVLPGLIEPKTIHQLEKKSVKEEIATETSTPWTTNGNLSLMTGYDANILQIADSIVPFASNLGSFYSANQVVAVRLEKLQKQKLTLQKAEIQKMAINRKKNRRQRTLIIPHVLRQVLEWLVRVCH